VLRIGAVRQVFIVVVVPRCLITLAVIGAALTAIAAGTAAHASTPVRGLSDDLAFTDSRPGQRAAAFREARRAGARVVRVTLDWSLVAPGGSTKPAGFDAADPADPAYRWGYVEDAVRDAAARRLRVLLVVVQAPVWAQRADGPDPGELAAFVRAAARRFSGFYPDPKNGGDGLTRPGRSLPAVRRWQIWDRANQTIASVGHYRAMLEASADALNQVDSLNRLIAGGTAGPGARSFWRGMRGATFDAAAHSGTSGLRRIRRAFGRRRPLWVTDVARGTPPLNPGGVTPSRQARILVEAIFDADRAGAELFSWQGLQDRRTHLANFPTIASGLFFNHTDSIERDPAKPARRAFGFPFLVKRSRAWGIAPRRGAPVAIERRGGNGWTLVTTVTAKRSGEFSTRVATGRGRYRARQAQARSLPWPR
jgi:hypothetical protein